MSYGNVFVGQIALGANPTHALKTILAAESYRGPSLLIAYCHCIGQGIDMSTAMTHQKEAVACGYWPLYSFDPREQPHPFKLASKKPTGNFKEFALKEGRFAMLARSKPERAEELLELARRDIEARWHYYEQLASLEFEAVRQSAAEMVAAAEAGDGKEPTGKQTAKELQK